MSGYADVRSFAARLEAYIRCKPEDFLADASSAGCGFLPKGGPLLTLDDAFNQFVQFGANLPILIEEKKVCETLDQMKLPQFTPEKYTYNALVRVYAVAASLVHAYILESGKNSQPNTGPVRLPCELSSWFETLSHQIGRLPTQTYETYVLQNYRLIDEESGYTLSNIDPLITYTGTSGEKWFIKMHVFAEHYVANVVSSVEKIRVLLTTQSIDEVGTQTQFIELLNTIHNDLSSLNRTYFSEMKKGLDPKQFYFKLRSFLSNWEHGVIYEGSSFYEEAVRWRGASGAQSSFMPAIDLVCQFNISQKETMCDMVNYMPPEHQAFLGKLRTIQVDLPTRIAATENRDLIEAYDRVSKESHAFRRKHYTLFVQPYIMENLVKMFTDKALDSFFKEHSEQLTDVQDIRDMFSKLLMGFFSEYKKLMLEHNMGNLLEVSSRSDLDQMMTRLKHNLFISQGMELLVSKNNFEEAVLASFRSIMQKTRVAYQRKLEFSAQPFSEGEERNLPRMFEKIFDQFVELSSKSLGTGGEDFSLFLQENVVDVKKSALITRFSLFSSSQRGESANNVSFQPSNTLFATCN